MHKTPAFLAIALAALCGCSKQDASSDLTAQVTTANGVIEGVKDDETGLHVFKGIPFAKPPVGALRWREPQPVENWEGVRQATGFGPHCMQQRVFDDIVFRSSGMSEDCLYLNVWTPAKSADERLPVLVYFYGGGFVVGDGSEARYDGASMAQRGIVALTVNYRLNAFGMFAHPELTKESPHGASGNYLLLDQNAALKWVQQNIAAFGGDPKRVTIAGESAGSFAVSAQMASPLSRDLIAGAIGESGAFVGRLKPLSEAEKSGTRFASTVGADSLEELRALPAERLLESGGGFGHFDPAILDGYFFPKSPADIYPAGEQAKVPLLAGTNSEEMPYQAILRDKPPSVVNLQEAIRGLYGEHADRVAAVYPATSEEEVMDAARELASDRFLSHGTWKWIDLHGSTSGKPTYYYYYAHPRPAPRADPQAPIPSGAVHAAEIDYAMGNLSFNDVFAWTEDDHEVSRIMQTYFANFIKTGDPNGEGLPAWRAYNSDSTYPRLTIDTNPQLVPDTRRARYQALDEIPQNAQ